MNPKVVATTLVEELRNKIDIAAAECDRGEGVDAKQLLIS